MSGTDRRLDVLDNARRFLRAFPVGSFDPSEEWQLLDGLVGHARELLALKAPAERIITRFNTDLAAELANVGLSPADVESIVATAGNGKRVGRMALAWANKQEADRQAKATPEPQAREATTQEDRPESRAIVTRASDIPARPTRWVWEERWPCGMVSLVAGREGSGKSSMVIDRAARVTRGDLEGVHYGCPRSVVIAAAEDSWSHTVIPRLMAAGADRDRVLRVQVRLADLGACEMSLPDDVELLREVIHDHDVGLVVLDPLISRLSRRLDTHRDAEVRLGLEPLAAMADATGVSVVGLIHVSKAATRDPLTSVMASRAFVAVTRAVLYVALDPDAHDRRRRVVSQVKCNVGRDDSAGLPSLVYGIEPATVETAEGEAATCRVVWHGVADRGVREILAAQEGAAGSSMAQVTAEEWLRGVLSAGPVLSVAVREQVAAAGLSWATVRRAQGSLGVRPTKAGGRFGGDPRWYWELPRPPEGAHLPLKMLTPEHEHLQAKVSTFSETLPPPAAPEAGEL